jgi:hypothetical protein
MALNRTGTLYVIVRKNIKIWNSFPNNSRYNIGAPPLVALVEPMCGSYGSTVNVQIANIAVHVQ